MLFPGTAEHDQQGDDQSDEDDVGQRIFSFTGKKRHLVTCLYIFYVLLLTSTKNLREELLHVTLFKKRGG